MTRLTTLETSSERRLDLSLHLFGLAHSYGFAYGIGREASTYRPIRRRTTAVAERGIKPPGAVTVSSTAELQDKYGAVVKLVAGEPATPYLLCKALRSQTPPLYVSDGIAKQCFKKYGTELQYIHSAGYLELCWRAYPRARQSSPTGTRPEGMVAEFIVSRGICIYLSDLAYQGLEFLRQIAEY